MEFHYRVHEDAGNQPNASTAYDLSGTAVSGAWRTFASVMTDGASCVVLAEEVDGNGNPSGAWEIAECTFADLATDTLTRDVIVDSSTGSAIDWATEAATPRLSLVDLATGMGRKVGEWDHDDAGDTATILFDPPGGFAAGRIYRLVIQGLVLAGSASAENIGFRCRRVGQGSLDTGSTDYQTQSTGRVRGGTILSNGIDAGYGNFTFEGMYGDTNAGWESYDQFNGQFCVTNLGEADHTSLSGVTSMARSSSSTGHAGVNTTHSIHKFQTACDQLALIAAGGSSFGAGRVILLEDY